MDLGWRVLEREVIDRHFRSEACRADTSGLGEESGRTSVAEEVLDDEGEGADEREPGSSVFIIVVEITATGFSVIRARDTLIRQGFCDMFQV